MTSAGGNAPESRVGAPPRAGTAPAPSATLQGQPVIATTEAVQRFGVLCIKDDGRRTLFARYGTREAAESAARALRAHALRAEVIETDALPSTPGAAIAVETRA